MISFLDAAAPTRRALLARAGAVAAAVAAVCTRQAQAAQALDAALDETWYDSARQRNLPLRLRWPSTPGPWPAIIYSHGLGGSRDGADVWGNAWAEAGFVVLHVQHPGSDTAVLRAGGLATLRAAATAEQLLAPVADVRFVLDEISRRQQAAAGPWQKVLLGAIGMAGHSFGAQTAQALAGQRYDSPGTLSEPRLRAFIGLSPSPGRSRLSVAEQFGDVQRPFMVVTGSLDGDPFAASGTAAADDGARRARVFDGLPAGQRALLWLQGADHMSFAGNRAQRINTSRAFQRQAIAQQLEDQHHAVVARISTLWWAAQLLPSALTRAALLQVAQAAELQPGDRWVLG